MKEEPLIPETESPSTLILRRAWASGWGRAAVKDALTPEVLADEALTAEILAADAEERWDRGEPATVETYLSLLPQLKSRSEACRSLLMCELARRDDRFDPAVADRLKDRLPELAEEIDVVVGFFQSFGGGAEGVPTTARGHVRPGDRLGSYELRERIGRGSFGEVWRAWDTVLERQIALKLLPQPAGGEGDSVLVEARAAAALEHDHIVRVHAAGRFADPALLYIDTQLVCDPVAIGQEPLGVRVGRSLEESAVGAPGSALPPRRAADIMEKVCGAVAAAHSRGVTHGDIKPGNILLTPSGRPMVADFGLAVLAPRETDRDSPTSTLSIEADGVRITGTPAYMSPEQAAGQRPTPLSDVYSLGATLVALLTGRPTFAPRPGARRASLDVVEQVRASAPDLAAVRGIDPTLGAICAKAMARAPDERYPGADRLSEDLRAWLDHRPTRARPLAVPGRLALWSRRHAVLVVVGLLAIGAIGGSSAWYIVSITRAEARAVAEAAKFRSVSKFLTSMLEASDPSRAQGDEITVREKLDDAAEELLRSPPESDEVAAALHGVVGATYMGLGRREEASPHLERALELQRAMHRGDHADLAQAWMRIGRLRWEQGRIPESEEAYTLGLDMHQRLSGRDAAEYIEAEHELAGLYMNLARYADAEPLIEHAEQVASRLLPPGDPLRLNIANTRAGLLQVMGRDEDAAAALRAVAGPMADALGPRHPTSLAMRMNLGIATSRTGRPDEAETIFRATLADAQAVVGPDHQITIGCMNGLARALDRLDRGDEAERLYRDALARAAEHLGEGSVLTLELMINLAQNLRAQGRFEEAVAISRRSLEAHSAVHGEHNVNTAIARGVLAMCLTELRADEEAEALFRQTLEDFERALPPTHPMIVHTLRKLETLYGPDRLDRPDQLQAVRARIAATGGSP